MMKKLKSLNIPEQVKNNFEFYSDLRFIWDELLKHY